MAHGGTGEEDRKYELELRLSKRPWNSFALACAILASLNPWLIGYDVGLMNVVAPHIKHDTEISKASLENLVGLTSILSSALGAAAAGRVADTIGRKRTLAVTPILFLLGVAIMLSSPSFLLLKVGRIVEGVGVGFALVITPLYISEMSPAYCRGFLVSLQDVFSDIGVLLGCTSGFLLTGPSYNAGWRVTMALGAFPAVMLAVGVWAMPESPRWLVMQNRIEEAEQVLLRTSRNRAEASLCLTEIMTAAGLSHGAGYTSLKTGAKFQGDRASSWLRFLSPTLAVKRMLVTAFGVQFFQQATGIETTAHYSQSLFNEAGIMSRWGIAGATMVVGLCKLMLAVLSALYQDRAGRRSLLLWSASGMCVSLGVLALGFSLLTRNAPEVSVPLELRPGTWPTFPAMLSVLALCSYVSFFSVGFGPGTGLLTSEIFPLTMRAQALGLATAVNRVTSGLLALFFLIMSDSWSASRAVSVLSLLSGFAILFVYQRVPETKGKTLEEMETLFQVRHVDKSFLRLGNRELPAESSVSLDSVPHETSIPGGMAGAKQEPMFGKRKVVPGTAKDIKGLFSRLTVDGTDLKGKDSLF